MISQGPIWEVPGLVSGAFWGVLIRSADILTRQHRSARSRTGVSGATPVGQNKRPEGGERAGLRPKERPLELRFCL